MLLLIMFCKIWFSSFSFLCLEILSKMYRNLERDKIRWVPKVLEVILMREGLCKPLIQQFVSFVHWKYKILLPTFIFSQFFTQLYFCNDWVEHYFIENRTNSNILFRTSNELKPVHLFLVKLEHHIFGFNQKDIEPNMAFTRFTM